MKFNIILCLSLVLASCNKDDSIEGCTDSSALNYNVDATVDNGSCSYSNSPNYALEFLVWKNDAAVSPGVCYSNLLVIVNNDTLQQNISGHQTNDTWVQIYSDYIDNGIAAPTNSISYSVSLNTVYEIKIIDGTTGNLYYTTSGEFKLDPDAVANDRDVFFDLNYGGSYHPEVWNTTNLNAQFPGGWDDESMGLEEVGNLGTSCLFVYGLVTY